MSAPVTILNPAGKPARVTNGAPRPVPCPQCGADPECRVASSGFGVAHPVCRRCGYEWMDEVFLRG